MTFGRIRLRTLLERIRTGAGSLVGWFQGGPLPVGAWCEPGVPTAVLVPLFVALPFAATAPLRAITGWSLVATLPMALVASAVALAPVIAAWRAGPRLGHPVLSHALPLLLALISIVALYRREFGGLTNYVGADAGVHVFQHRAFVESSPRIYVGFVSMYGLMYWIEQLARCNVFWALCGVFYFGVAVVAAIPCIVALIALEPFATRRAWYAGALGCAGAALALAYYVVLPQQHYHQTDGFFAHLFGLVPLTAAWLVDTAARARLWRWLGLVACVALYRYTYGLNLADILIALGVVLFADSFGAGVPRPVRWLLRLTPLLMIWVGISVLRELRPQLANYGWIIAYDLPTVLWAQAWAIAGVGLVLLVSRWLPPQYRVLLRALRLPIAFAAVGGVVAHVAWRLPAREPYYVLKYPVQSVVLMAGAMVVVVAFVAAHLADALARRAWTRPVICWGLSLCACWLALAGWRRGYAPFQPGFQERVFGHAPYTWTHPLADLRAWPRIKGVLEAQHKRFGGYVTWHWPMFNFMNAALGYYNGGRAFWDHGGVRLEPGYCVFWDRDRTDVWLHESDVSWAIRSTLAMLNARSDRTCVSYRAHWNSAFPRTLCHVCQ
jgi:hypothetical protein